MKTLYLFAVIILLSATSFAQQQEQQAIYYAVSFPNAVHHEAEIVITIPQATGIIRLRMSRSSPGRYATHEFGKNIYNIKAANANGTPLVVNQLEGDLYEIPAHGDNVKVSYTLFANWVDGTYSGIDASHAHLNMPATFMWVAGQENRPVKFQFNDLDKYGWKVATQLKHEGANLYSAPDMQYMMDSPTELSDYKLSRWEVDNNGKKEKISLAIHADADQAIVNSIAKKLQKVVLEEKAVFGELPDYDYGEYTFLTDVYPSGWGDGMEHRNSTCITFPYDDLAKYQGVLFGTFSHEFFHCWNVKRIRPKSLEPFNFEHANISSELWFAEGFTQYYGEMLLARSGIRTINEYNKVLAGLINQVLNTPAATKYPATQMSRYAVFADAGVSIDPNNQVNYFTSYYYYGGAIALALDLRLRSEFNLTLDDYMRTVWLNRGKVMKPYTIPDLQSDLGALTNDPKFAADFFNRYIYGTDKNNYEKLLAKAGLLLRKAQAGKAWAGPLTVEPGRGKAGMAKISTGEGLALQTNTVIGTPIYKAGLDAGDIMLKADGKKLKDIKTFTDIVADKKPGDKLIIDYRNRTGEHKTTLVLEDNPAFDVVTFEEAGKALTAEQSGFRNNWLSSKVK